MPPKKKSETKSTAGPKTGSKPKAAAKPRAPRKTVTASEKMEAPKAPKALKIEKASSPRKTAGVPEKIAAAEPSPMPKTEKSPSSRKPAPAKPAGPVSPASKLPKHGETQMVAFIRDPQCIFTYWEVTPESIESVKRQLMGEFQGSSMVLRVYHTGGSDGQVELTQEIFVEPDEMNRYIEINDRNGGYFLEIAQKALSGRTVVYARSNRIMLGSSESSSSSASSDAKWEMPSALLEYFSQEEYSETFLTPGGISSAESLKRKKSRFASSNFK